MVRGSSVVGLTFDASVAWPVYNWMGVAKAALEGDRPLPGARPGAGGVRVNLVAAGPVPTTAAKAIPGFEEIEGGWAARAPLGWDVADAGPTARRCLSDWFPATTAEVPSWTAACTRWAVAPATALLRGRWRLTPAYGGVTYAPVGLERRCADVVPAPTVPAGVAHDHPGRDGRGGASRGASRRPSPAAASWSSPGPRSTSCWPGGSRTGSPTGRPVGAMAAFPAQPLVERVLTRYLRPGGRAPGTAYTPVAGDLRPTAPRSGAHRAGGVRRGVARQRGARRARRRRLFLEKIHDGARGRRLRCDARRGRARAG